MIKNIPKTERTYKKSKPIDHLSSNEAISLMIKEQKDASLGVYKAIKSIGYCSLFIPTPQMTPQ